MNVAQNTASTQANALLGSFLNGSLLKVYQGAIPATPETALTTQTLLATITLPASSAFTQSNGVLTAAAITSPTVAASGTANFFRWFKADATTVIADGYIAPTTGISAYANNTAVTAGNFITANGNTYIVTTSGTTATTGNGPTLRSPGVPDGTAVFAYVDLLLGTTALGAGATLPVSSFTMTIPSV